MERLWKGVIAMIGRIVSGICLLALGLFIAAETSPSGSLQSISAGFLVYLFLFLLPFALWAAAEALGTRERERMRAFGAVMTIIAVSMLIFSLKELDSPIRESMLTFMGLLLAAGALVLWTSDYLPAKVVKKGGEEN